MYFLDYFVVQILSKRTIPALVVSSLRFLLLLGTIDHIELLVGIRPLHRFAVPPAREERAEEEPHGGARCPFIQIA